ncbi:biopolymer transporter ExbD [Arcobacter sp. FWKO B]|uniref:biopolymer transporter ExbD n=1 Tax=Arcobacter sp. FWKO B TaxID=2593672 RepID=UPI0018A48C00|nr:biopolymer transporter ExbD [Arcobacter sp. FWKO B]QOG11758.1 biopolymer transporter ExbD [Arcobacter sp. FWKO B]
MFDYNEKPELNITPLVDVMLVLLAILMVTAPVLEYEENINLPTGSRSQTAMQTQKLDILIDKNRVVKVEKNSYNIKEFADSFVMLTQDRNKDIYIYIKADKTLQYEDIIYVLKTVKEAGFSKVSLITDG